MALDIPSLAAAIRGLYPQKVVARVLETAAPPDFAKYKSDPVGFIRDVLGKELTPDQQEIAWAFPGRVKVNSGHNVGKAQNVETIIDTPDGRRWFGDLEPGDRVFGANGKPTTVTAVYPQGVIPQFRVSFDDGTSTTASAEHLWSVQGRQQRRPDSKHFGHWLVLTTAEIKARGLYRKNGSGKIATWTIPQQGAVEYPTRELDVPPYTMGYWLGNGTVGVPNVTTGDDPEIVEWIRAETGCEITVRPDPDSKSTTVVPLGFKHRLRASGVMFTPTDKKRVPRPYLENDIAFRHALLQGLMDSDGTAGKGGQCTFSSSSRGLTRDVMWLVRSLGGRASMHPTVKKPTAILPDGTVHHYKPSYICTVRLDDRDLFRLARKQERVNENRETRQFTRNPSRWITAIEPEGMAEMVCITVDAPDGLYLTNDFIVTHNTFLAACLVLWWFYTRPNSVVVTTAPTERDVIDLLWTEVRILHRGALVALPKFFIGPRAPEMFDNDEHWAKGYTASKGEGFQGRHRASMLFVFDECEGVDPPYWTTTNTMFQPSQDHAWLAIGNPTTTSSQSYLEDMAMAPGGGSKWRLFSLSALNHPNVLAELEGKPPPIPNAVTLGQVDQWLTDWADPVPPGDGMPMDVEWPPTVPCPACTNPPEPAPTPTVPVARSYWPGGESPPEPPKRDPGASCGECGGTGRVRSGKFYRPGPSFLSRVMGIRPGEGVDTVWSAAAFGLACNPAVPTKDRLVRAWGAKAGLNIGVDPAAFGDDDTAIHIRIGPVSVWHESHNGWGPDRTAGRLKALCEEWTAFYNALAIFERPLVSALDVEVTIEGDGGYGSGIVSHAGDYRRWRLASASQQTTIFMNGRPTYANLRAQWWCESAKIAAAGGMDFSMLPQAVRDRLRIQLLAPMYWNLPGNGARIVEPKKDVKERMGRSPDDADALILSHYTVQSFAPSVVSTDDEDLPLIGNR